MANSSFFPVEKLKSEKCQKIPKQVDITDYGDDNMSQICFVTDSYC